MYFFFFFLFYYINFVGIYTVSFKIYMCYKIITGENIQNKKIYTYVCNIFRVILPTFRITKMAFDSFKYLIIWFCSSIIYFINLIRMYICCIS